MVEQIGMRPPDPRGDSFQRYRLRPRFEQQSARGLQRIIARFFGREAAAGY